MSVSQIDRPASWRGPDYLKMTWTEPQETPKGQIFYIVRSNLLNGRPR